MKAKRIVSILLAIMLVFGVIPPTTSLAAEDEPIYTIEIKNLSLPKEGGNPDYFVNISQEAEGYYIALNPENGNEQNGVIWSELIDQVSSKSLKPGESVFEVGKTYSMCIAVDAEEGYYFPENEYGAYEVSAYINGMPASVSGRMDVDRSKGLAVSMEFTVDKEYNIIVKGGTAYNGSGNATTEEEWAAIESTTAGTRVKVAADEKEGWEFDHWKIEEGEIPEFVNRSSTFFNMPECDVRLRAYYREENGEEIVTFHDVIFCFGDSPIAWQTVATGRTVVKPEDPAQENMNFLGWYTTDGKCYDFSTPVTKDITLTAKFECKTHSWNSGNVIKKATCTSSGTKKFTCKRCGKTKTNTIYKASSVKLSTATYTYNGKMKSPTVVVKNSQGKTISSSNYTISRPTGRKNVGKYTYKIIFKNDYSGTKKLTLTINPKGTSISSLANAKKAFAVKWKKQSDKMATSRITGYQIQYSTSKKFTNPKLKTVTGYSTTSRAVTGLKAKTTYYVRVRTYKTIKFNDESVKLYSPWSSYKYVKTK